MMAVSHPPRLQLSHPQQSLRVARRARVSGLLFSSPHCMLPHALGNLGNMKLPHVPARLRHLGNLQLPAPLRRATPLQRALALSLTGAAAVAALRWRALLSAAASPALALAAASWLLAHESRGALEEDLALLLRPQRRRRAAAPRRTLELSSGYDADVNDGGATVDVWDWKGDPDADPEVEGSSLAPAEEEEWTERHDTQLAGDLQRMKRDVPDEWEH